MKLMAQAIDHNATIRGALFDLDGVLIDTEGAYSRFWDEVDRRYPTGIPDFSSSIKGSNLHEILYDHYPDAETRQQVCDLLDQFQTGMRFDYFPGAIEFVTALRRAGMPLAVVTSSDSTKMEALYAQHPEFPALFDTIITGDMVKHAKPHPECFLKGAEAIGRDIDKCFVFEDSLRGLEAGMRSGAKVVGLATTNSMTAIADKCHLAVTGITDISLDQLLSL